ncbi:hypothetical protein GF312_12980 [Candidatus Poribacteria bacterium]|nr:hypothetical protein [Candidatus Poribacteria bacterium]
MIKINLLLPEDRPKKLVSLGNMIILVLVLLLGVSIIMPSIMLLSSIQDYSSRVAYRREEIKLYRQQVEDIRELSKKVKLLNTRLSLVKELLQEKSTWSDKLAELCQYLPDNEIWLNELIIERKKEEITQVAKNQNDPNAKPTIINKVQVQILGSAISVEKVSQFVAFLEDSQTFDNIVFDSTGNNSRGAEVDPFKSFSLTFEIVNNAGES